MIDRLMPLTDVLIRVLGHSIWQGGVLAVLMIATLRCLPARRSELRYALTVTAMLLLVVSAFVTASWLRVDQAPNDIAVVAASVIEPIAAEPNVEPTSSTSMQAVSKSTTPSPVLPQASVWPLVLSVGWLMGALTMLARGLRGFILVRAWIADCSANARAELLPLEELVRDISTHMALRRRVRLLACDRLTVPAVVGSLWPIILVPTAMLTGVPIEQWRIILAHELAHVRRWDGCVSLLQLVVESLMFFNPAIWWISRQIRHEREACCDTLAAQVCGQSLSVARTLVDVAARICDSSAPLASDQSTASQRATSQPAASLEKPAELRLALSFAEHSDRGELTDRVRRLIDPDRAPNSRMTWLGLGVVLCALVLTAMTLQWGTDIAIRAAAEWMTPKQRVEKMVELEAQRNSNFIGMNEAIEQGRAEVKDVEIELVIRTEDGSDVTRELQISSISKRDNSSEGSSLSGPDRPVKEFRQTIKKAPCQLRLVAKQPGWAPVFSPVLTLMPNEEKRAVELVLKRGRELQVDVRNDDGDSIPGAWLKLDTHLQLRGGSTGWNLIELQTDANGRASIQHMDGGEFSLAVLAPGYQRLQQLTTFTSETELQKPLTIKLVRARSTSVRVLDSATDEPIANARLRLTIRRSRSSSHHNSFHRETDKPNRWNDFAQTNNNGIATIDQLEDDIQYLFAVLAPGFAHQIVVAQAGDAAQTIRLQRPLSISGRLTGAIDRLHRWNYSKTGPDSSTFRFGANVRLNSVNDRFGSNSIDDNLTVKVEADGRFEITNIAPGEIVTLGLPDQQPRYVVTESLKDLVLDIAPKSDVEHELPPMREVILRITGVQPDAPARGALRISASHSKSTEPRYGRVLNQLMRAHIVQDNEIRLQVPIDTTMNFSDGGLAGYIISESTHFQVLAGTEPLVIDVPATTAGGIHGKVFRSDGSLATSAFVTAFATQLPSTEKDHRRINPSSMSGGSEYLRKVPLGGRYRLLAREQTETGYVWTVSDEIVVDASQPIHEVPLKLPVGKEYSLKLIDSKGKPVKRQHVRLQVGFSLNHQNSHQGFSFDLEGQSNEFGIVTWPGLSMQQPVAPLNLTAYASVIPGPFTGTTHQVDPTKSSVLTLQPGLEVNGKLIDASNRKPISRASIRLAPHDYSKAQFKQWISGSTDVDGWFQFKGLENMPYVIHVDGAYPKGTVIEPQADGTSRIQLGGASQMILEPASDVTPVWEVVIDPRGSLSRSK